MKAIELSGVVRQETNQQVSDFFRWLTHTHTMRWHAHYQTQGTGHLYQGRFKTFPIEEDNHLRTVLRYVEENPVRANFAVLQKTGDLAVVGEGLTAIGRVRNCLPSGRCLDQETGSSW